MSHPASVYIHPSAYADEGCRIGDNTKIWHFCHIMPKAIIGSNCSLGQNVFVANSVVIGNNVKIQNNVSLYEGVVCEDDVFLGPSMVLTNVINPRSGVERKSEYKKTLIKKGTSIGANATIVCGVTLGEYCFIGAGAVVNKDVPAFALIVGVPGKQVGWMSKQGHRLHFDAKNTAVCPGSGEKYLLEGSVVKLA
jgi:UDP-2-acetamido-3-amino-2,3-dideoxy-glucuronate N-acetyltransferase